MLAPCVQAALQRANVLDALLAQQDRQLRAGSFVGTRAIKNNLPVARELVVLLAKLLGVHAKSARNGFRISLEIQGMAKIDDDHVFALVDLRLEFIHGDAGNAQLTDEALALVVFVADIAHQRADEQHQQAATQGSGMIGDALDLFAENVA